MVYVHTSSTLTPLQSRTHARPALAFPHVPLTLSFPLPSGFFMRLILPWCRARWAVALRAVALWDLPVSSLRCAAHPEAPGMVLGDFGPGGDA